MNSKTLKQQATKKRWAFLIYIAGDNNLSDAGLEDIQELCDEGASENVHVGVEIDTYGEHTGSIRYEITEPDWTAHAHRTVIERLPEKDSGDPETLKSFVKWGLDRYAAENYAMVVWNHGSGFRSVRRDIGYDDFGSSLDMPEVEHALTQAGIGPKNKVAVLGFDACLMSMLEIANHFRDQVDVLVGSQQTEPGDGWPYDKVLKAIKESPDGPTLGKQIVRVYIEDYRNRGIFDVTQSAIITEKTESAVQALSELGTLLAERTGTRREAIKRLRLRLQTFEMADYVDLVHAARLIPEYVEDDAVRAAAKYVEKTAGACIHYSERLGAAVENATGLSVWFPAQEALYYNYRMKYLALRFAREHTGWIRFLDSYHS